MALVFSFEEGRKELFKKGYTQLQVDGINAIVKEANDQGVKVEAQLAYILATAYHEGYNPKFPESRLTPIEEFGGLAYLKSKWYYPYFGRGYAQLTLLSNYMKYQPIIKAKFNVDIMKNPEALLRVDIAAFVIVHGMMNGVYANKKLSTYVNSEKVNFKEARRVVNGVDKKELIAGIANQFVKCVATTVAIDRRDLLGKDIDKDIKKEIGK